MTLCTGLVSPWQEDPGLASGEISEQCRVHPARVTGGFWGKALAEEASQEQTGLSGAGRFGVKGHQGNDTGASASLSWCPREGERGMIMGALRRTGELPAGRVWTGPASIGK